MCLKLGFLEVPIHAPDRRGETPFFRAVRSEALQVMGVLLKHGADVNQTDNSNKSALILASQMGNYQSVEWLIKQGANLKHIEGYDRDALYWAKQNDHPKIAELLQEHLGRA